MENIFKADLICIKSGTSMSQAGLVMKNNRIRHLPIIDESDRITGMLSQSDLTDVQKFADFPVDLFASFPVHTISVETPLSTAAFLMIEKKISSILLTDSEGSAVGIITSDDLLFQLAQLLKQKETAAGSEWDTVKTLTTAGEFFRKLSDIGI